MNLLQIIASMSSERGGPRQGVRNFIPPMEKEGVFSEVLTLDCRIPTDLEDEEIIIHPLGPAYTSWGYTHNLSSWLKQNINRFDAILIRECWQYPLVATAQACKREGIPYFIMPHGTLDPWFQRTSSRRVKAARNWIYWKLLLERYISNAEGLFFTCETEKLLARETFQPYRPKQELVVGYGILDPVEQYMSSATETRSVYNPFAGSLLFLGRIDPKKGVDLLIQAYAKLCSEVESGELRLPEGIPDLIIAGPGQESDYGQTCRKMCKSADLEVATSLDVVEEPKAKRNGNGRVVFPGMLLGEQKWTAFRSAAAMVLPSHQENFGIVVAEALACGTPVLLSDQVNIWREVEAAGAGLVAKDTLEGTYDLLHRWLILSIEDQKEIKSKARNCFETFFRVERSAKAMTDAMKAVL